MTEFHDKGIEITVTRSGGPDGAIVVFIDTPNWEPDASDGGPGLRVLINESSAYEGVKYEGVKAYYENAPKREAGVAKLTCTLDEIDYTDKEKP